MEIKKLTRSTKQVFFGVSHLLLSMIVKLASTEEVLTLIDMLMCVYHRHTKKFPSG